MQGTVTTSRVAWSLTEIAEATGLSIGFLRNDVRRGALPTRKFGRRILVLDEDLKAYLYNGSVKDQPAVGNVGC
jgi:excisionase family DNA binding protein